MSAERPNKGMTTRPIIDAGPGLNFFSINKERLLIATLGPLSAPEAVRDEILRKAQHDARFKAAATVWGKLSETYMQVLPDDVTPALEAVVTRISKLPMTIRSKQSKDLGETMVIAHAVATAETGADMTILIDDGPGSKIAAAEANRLRRIQAMGRAVGSLRLVSTITVLERAAGGEHLPNKGAMRETYGRLRTLDDGLPPIGTTNLLASALWP